ncbi:dNA methylase [Clostridium sp. CAG:914]|nr:dNA methylase [Clostridium sp. CAG:914]
MKGIITLQVNKIYNEDCLVGLKKIPDNSIDLVVIGPPYDICTKGGKKGSVRLCEDLTKLENELKESNLVNGYDLSILDELIRVMKEINIYIWCNGIQIPIYMKNFVDKFDCKLEIIIWGKTNSMPLIVINIWVIKNIVCILEKVAIVSQIIMKMLRQYIYLF